MCLKPFLQLTPCDFGANSLLIRERELNQVHFFSVPSKIVGRSSLSDKKVFKQNVRLHSGHVYIR